MSKRHFTFTCEWTNSMIDNVKAMYEEAKNGTPGLGGGTLTDVDGLKMSVNQLETTDSKLMHQLMDDASIGDKVTLHLVDTGGRKMMVHAYEVGDKKVKDGTAGTMLKVIAYNNSWTTPNLGSPIDLPAKLFVLPFLAYIFIGQLIFDAGWVGVALYFGHMFYQIYRHTHAKWIKDALDSVADFISVHETENTIKSKERYGN